MSYQANVQAAAAALKRGEDANWELARLTSETTLDAGRVDTQVGKVPMEQWCADVRAASDRRFGPREGRRYKKTWREHGGTGSADHVSWAEAYWLSTKDEHPEEMTERIVRSKAIQASPETKRQVARDLLDDPDVTSDPEVQDRVVRTAGSSPRLTARTIEHADEHRPAPPARQRDPNALDYIAALGVGSTAVMALRRLHDDVSTLVAVLRNDAVRLNDQSRDAIREDAADLRKASDIARMYADEIEIALEGGVSDQRLEDLLNEGIQ
jgi:hypothetical protein